MTETNVDTLLLEPEKAIEASTDPQGIAYYIAPSKLYPGLYAVHCKDADPNKKAPKELRGYWTSKEKGNNDLRTYLTRQWDTVERKLKPSQKVARDKQLKELGGDTA